MNFKQVLFGLAGWRVVRRWSDEELKVRKAELEARLKDRPTDVASLMEISEYWVQRYLPRDTPLTQARWRRMQAQWQRHIAESEAKGWLTPEALEAERRELAARQGARRAVLLSSYVMPAEAFDQIVGRLLAQIIGPLDRALLNRLYIATGPDKWPASDARDGLIGTIDERFVDLVAEWRRTYEHLRRAQNAGYPWVSVSSDRRCVCQPVHRRTVMATSDLVAAFEQPGREQSVFPSPLNLCLTDESPRFCRVLLQERDEPHTSTEDPAFEAWLDEMSARRGPVRSANTGLAHPQQSP